MIFKTKIIFPSYSRGSSYNSIESVEKNILFDCVNCEYRIKQKFDSLIGKAWSWKEDFTSSEVEQINNFYKMNVVGKSPDGGWTAIKKTGCEKCCTNYLIYAGVNEYANSAYSVTLQGITEIIENE